MHTVRIAGKSVNLAWTVEAQKRFRFRASKIGGAPTHRDFSDPSRATSAVASLLWLLLPPDALADYPTPEELYVGIEDETEAPAIHTALSAIVAEMSPTPEKKTNSKKSPSRK